MVKINKELPDGKQAILTEQDKLEKLTNAIKNYIKIKTIF